LSGVRLAGVRLVRRDDVACVVIRHRRFVTCLGFGSGGLSHQAP